MKVKTFHALTMQDAIRAIKEELGPEAIILSSREVRQGGRLLRLFNRPVLEVMAASEQDSLPPPPSRAELPQSAAVRDAALKETPSPLAAHDFQETLRAMLQTAPVTNVPPKPVTTAPLRSSPARKWKQERLQHLRTELRELSRLLGDSLPIESQSLGTYLPPELTTMCRSFVQQGMRPSTAESIGNEILQSLDKETPCHHEAITLGLAPTIAARLRVAGPLLQGEADRTVALLLGPSGSGKTSALTKLAAHYRLEEKKSVAIVTFDTYREAAVEQLRMYAGVLGVPFASALSARQVHDGLRRQRQADLVLIDMPGVGPDEVALAKELHQLLQAESELSTHLVLSASMRDSDLHRIVDRVTDLPLLRLLFTKLDETESFGAMLELAHQTGIPLSYWSVGQRVPEDLEVASPDRMAELLLARRYVAPRMPESRSFMSSHTEAVPEPVGAMPGQIER